ncbi:hypothetical protein IE53DRAFT_64676 [Violaceomyces palustris]|uniref:Uncharacterized protein n=1 Tax=Violaceomyces palustris TaxID=1673888 RepID=A0ACD0P794_9BASI|nr:hypothetical protein IE53DRAFT_64676 [Violaceomyces palustris]
MSQSSRPSKKRTMLTEFHKGEIIGMRRAGCRTSKISRELGIHYSTISCFLNKFEKTGSSENRYHHNGSPKYTGRDIGRLIRDFQSSPEARKTPLDKLGQAEGGMSASTVRRYLEQHNLITSAKPFTPSPARARKQNRKQGGLVGAGNRRLSSE